MRQAFAEYAGALPVESGAQAETLEDVEQAMAAGGAVLAFVDDTPIGSARFATEDSDLYVGRVSVLPSHRRRGVASVVMRFLESVAAERGLAAIRIGVRDSLPSNVGLYQSLGYELVSIDPHPRGPDRVWTMKKWITT
jgi:ribosomal protein S18 acetylase RimI-like enzyme